MSRSYRDAGDLADALLAAVGNDIVLGLPVGLGKAAQVANALYARAVADASIQLTIFTALALEPPLAGNELERRFLEPLAARLFGGWPTLAFVAALRANALPRNVRVREFYFRPAAWLGNADAQQNYTSINYSQVADELVRLGVNVIGQLVSARRETPGRLSLSCNPEVTLDLLPYFRRQRARGARVALVAEVNRQLPYMTGDAELDAGDFDLALDDGGPGFPLFGLPNRAVGAADYATGMHVASLVADGGTLQLGIGSLSDAVAHCLKLRHERPAVFADVLERLPRGGDSRTLPPETTPFSQGLYACSELMSDALFALFRHGIVRRPADSHDTRCIHAGFFLGSSAFYDALRHLPESERQRIGMSPISFVNTLFGDESRKRGQRRKARFVNETMMATLLGAAVSDGLEDGRVVSGVGGQFDFVMMGHALDDGLSILMLRAVREHEGRVRSNIRWSYGHATVPRHLRDVFVTEYGVAATRGASDRDVVAAMLSLADARFQPQLLRAARAHGKVGPDFRLEASNNTPQALADVFTAPEVAAYFPRYPLGTELTPVEQELADALSWLQKQTATPLRRMLHVVKVHCRRSTDAHADALQRMGLGVAKGPAQRVLRRLLADALERYTT